MASEGGRRKLSGFSTQETAGDELHEVCGGTVVERPSSSVQSQPRHHSCTLVSESDTWFSQCLHCTARSAASLGSSIGLAAERKERSRVGPDWTLRRRDAMRE
jgi:hypothetical protein